MSDRPKTFDALAPLDVMFAVEDPAVAWRCSHCAALVEDCECDQPWARTEADCNYPLPGPDRCRQPATVRSHGMPGDKPLRCPEHAVSVEDGRRAADAYERRWGPRAWS